MPRRWNGNRARYGAKPALFGIGLPISISAAAAAAALATDINSDNRRGFRSGWRYRGLPWEQS